MKKTMIASLHDKLTKNHVAHEFKATGFQHSVSSNKKIIGEVFVNVPIVSIVGIQVEDEDAIHLVFDDGDAGSLGLYTSPDTAYSAIMDAITEKDIEDELVPDVAPTIDQTATEE